MYKVGLKGYSTEKKKQLRRTEYASEKSMWC